MLLLQPALGQFIVTSPSSKHHSAVQLCTIVHRISVYLSLYLSYLFALTQIVVVVLVQKVKALDFSKVLYQCYFCYCCGVIYSLFIYIIYVDDIAFM